MSRGASARCPDALAIALAAVAAADAGTAVREAIAPHGRGLRLRALAPVAIWPGAGRLLLFAVGKAAGAMLDAAGATLGERVDAAYALVPLGYPLPRRPAVCAQARHPGPGADAVAATRRLLEAVGGTRSDDLVIVLLSGGASAVLEDPVEGVDPDEIEGIVAHLQAGGASIHELNQVRRALSRIKGGGLARRLRPARLWTLAVSDVPDDDPATIGSGPTIPATPPGPSAWRVLRRFGLAGRLSPAVRAAVARAPAQRQVEDPGDRYAIVANLGSALAGARRRAAMLGYPVQVLPAPVCGEAREVAVRLLRRAAAGAAGRRRFCLLAGGETTVTVRGAGRGGRTQEIALAAALDTDAAGACVDGDTIGGDPGRRREAARALAENDSYSFLQRVGALVRTGPTGTNVMDVQVVTVEGGAL